jgi:starvation-inducible outer membrane lipoprotein
MQLNKLILLAVCAVMLSACGTVTPKDMLRATQSAVNLNKIYENSTVKEEVKWRIRSAVGQ